MASSRRPVFAGLLQHSGPLLRACCLLPLVALSHALPAPAAQEPPEASRIERHALDPAVYVLGPGDRLSLAFLDPETVRLGGGFTIEGNGSASLPLLGSVQLAGLTVSQAARWLGSIYGRSLPRPDLHLTLTDPRPLRISVLGEVLNPGPLSLPPTATPLTAIVRAGGLTSRADGTVLLRRAPPEAADTLVLDLGALLARPAGPAAERQQPLQLRDGDILTVGRGSGPLLEALLPLSGERLHPSAPLWSNLRLDGSLP